MILVTIFSTNFQFFFKILLNRHPPYDAFLFINKQEIFTHIGKEYSEKGMKAV